MVTRETSPIVIEFLFFIGIDEFSIGLKDVFTLIFKIFYELVCFGVIFKSIRNVLKFIINIQKPNYFAAVT